MGETRYLELYVPCPDCALVEVEVSIADGGIIEILAHELCPNELGPRGHTPASDDRLRSATRFTLSQRGLLFRCDGRKDL